MSRTVMVRPHTRKMPAKKPDPFQELIDARLAGQPVRFPKASHPKQYWVITALRSVVKAMRGKV